MESYLTIKIVILIASIIYGGALILLGIQYRSNPVALSDYKDIENITTDEQKLQIARFRGNCMLFIGITIFLSSLLSILFNLFALAFFIMAFLSISMMIYIPYIREKVIYGGATKNSLKGVLIFFILISCLTIIGLSYYRKTLVDTRKPATEKGISLAYKS